MNDPRLAPIIQRHGRTSAVGHWRPADVVTLVAVVCYGAAALLVAAGLFVRLASLP